MATHSHGRRDEERNGWMVAEGEEHAVTVDRKGNVRSARAGTPMTCANCGHHPLTGQTSGDEKPKPPPRLEEHSSGKGVVGCVNCGHGHQVEMDKPDPKLQAWAVGRRKG